MVFDLVIVFYFVVCIFKDRLKFLIFVLFFYFLDCYRVYVLVENDVIIVLESILLIWGRIFMVFDGVAFEYFL